jgi:hypothetical protein
VLVLDKDLVLLQSALQFFSKICNWGNCLMHQFLFISIVEDHEWFEDWWMVASLCDELLTTLCGLILG